jgi:hypothetical protein
MIEIINDAPCNCTAPVSREVMLHTINTFIEEIGRRHPAKFHGMVDCRVKDEDWECCPAHPDSLSCPQSGCVHCRTVDGSSP